MYYEDIYDPDKSLAFLFFLSKMWGNTNNRYE